MTSMNNKKLAITGNFGGGGGRKPKRDPDNLNNTEYAKVIDVISEGITEGFATPSKKMDRTTYDNSPELYDFSEADQAQYRAYAMEDVYVDDTPLRDPGAGTKQIGIEGEESYLKGNFNGFHDPTHGNFEVRHGTRNQALLTSMGELTTEKVTQVGQTVETDAPITKQVVVGIPSMSTTQSLAPEAVKVTIATNGLQESQDDGDLLGRTVEFQIIFQYKGAGFTDPNPTVMVQDKFEGRTGDMYRREYIIPTESFNRDSYKRYPLEITVKRLTASNQNNDKIQDDIQFSSFTEIQKPVTDYEGQSLDNSINIDNGDDTFSSIINGQFTYPYTAYSFLRFDAFQFSNIPRRTFRYRGIKCRIPGEDGASLSPTVDATGNGRIEYPNGYIFNGTLSNGLFWTTDPAFILLDLVLNTRYGFGKYIKEAEVDLYSFYQASLYCSALVEVQAGHGIEAIPGKWYEPRFTFNGGINRSVEAYTLIKEICGVMRVYPVWSGGKLTLIQDRPSDPAYIFSLANTLNGFSYSGTSLKTRHGKVVIEYFNMNTRQLDTVVVTNNQVYSKTHNIKRVKAFGTTSFSQAVRYGRNIIWSENKETDVVTFDVSIESGAVVRPGTVVKINDPVRAGIRRAGRVSAITLDGNGHLTSLTIDDSTQTDLPTEGDASVMDRQIGILDTSGTLKTGNIATNGIAGKVITLDSPLAPSTNCTFQANTMWVIENNVQSQLYRIVDVEEQGVLYKFTGVPYDAAKYDFIDSKWITTSNQRYSLQNPTFAPDARSISVLDQDRGGPESVNHTEFLRHKNGTVVSVLSISFASVLGCNRYLIRYRHRSGSLNTQSINIYGQPSISYKQSDVYGPYAEFVTEALTFEISPARIGTYQIEVFSVNPLGVQSLTPKIVDIEALGRMAAPASPSALNYVVRDNSLLELSWDMSSDIDVTVGGHTILRYNADTTGAATWGNSSVLAILPGTHTSTTVPLLTGEYSLKFQDSSLVECTTAASAIVTKPDFLTDEITVSTKNENGGFAGVKTALVVSTDPAGLILNNAQSLVNIDDVKAGYNPFGFGEKPEIDDLTNFDTLDAPVAVTSGTYEYHEVLDLGAKYLATFERILKFEGFKENNLFDEYVPAVVLDANGNFLSGGVDALTDFDASIYENASASVEVAASDDNNTYTQFNPFFTSNIQGRYFKFRAKLNSTTTSLNIVVTELGYKVTMVKRTENSDTKTSNVQNYTFTNGFFTTFGSLSGFVPSVTINPLNLGTGEYYEVTNISGTGFTVTFKNASGGTLTNKQFTYSASGYGSKL